MIKSYAACSWLGPHDLHEGWFAGVWMPLIDRCLHGIPSLSVLRTEIKSTSSDIRSRFDGIIRAQLADGIVHELGCIEVARVKGATHANKEEVDAGKLIAGLHDMLLELSRTVDHDEAVMKEIQVVGIQNVGFKISIFTMQMVGPNVVVLQRGQGRNVPIELKDFGQLVHVMRAVIRVKKILERTIEAVRQWEEARVVKQEDSL